MYKRELEHLQQRKQNPPTKPTKQHPQCTYCHRLGHTRNRCYQLHGRPPHLNWLSLLIIHQVQVLSQGAYPHLRGSFLRPANMSTFISLKQPNLPPLLLLSRPIMSLLALHIHLHFRSLILEPLITSLVIRPFFVSYLSVSFTHYYLS